MFECVFWKHSIQTVRYKNKIRECETNDVFFFPPKKTDRLRFYFTREIAMTLPFLRHVDVGFQNIRKP